jgi:hypothetical protein
MERYPNISDFLKTWLDDEEIKEIADRVGVTSYLGRWKVMTGKSKNHRLRNQWIEAAKRNEENQKQVA